jgi:thiol-disulfide isomerase/thioredoxin
MNGTRTGILILTLVAIAAAIFYLQSQNPTPRASTAHADLVRTQQSPGAADRTEKAKMFPRAKEIVDPSGFVNTDGIRIKDLIGKKVILVDFWTYSCINCQRTTPYLNDWYTKYKDKGLEIIGVHTPEFEFEKSRDNVARAVEKFGIKYPVVMDNDYATWRAYGNQYWPREYLIDIDGYIVHDHIGEGGYDETELKIQDLLTERMATLGEAGAVNTPLSAPVDATNVTGPVSPETYFGAGRNEYLGNGTPFKIGPQTLSAPTTPKQDLLYLVGAWRFEDEYATSAQAGNKIIYRYQGKNVYLVATDPVGAVIHVTRDGKPLGSAAGADVGADGTVRIKESRLYELVEDPAGYGEHELEIQIDAPGIQFYTFTFG